MSLQPTASQTVGPFFHLGLAWMGSVDLAKAAIEGERVTIQGRVLDGDGLPVNDAVLEFWQADAAGIYRSPGESEGEPASAWTGFGRVAVDGAGAFCLTTIRPGRVAGPENTLQAPHLVVAVFMRGLLRHLLTRIYFPGEPSNQGDPILGLIPPDRRSTLIARQSAADGAALEWNVILQGPEETVFFDY